MSSLDELSYTYPIITITCHCKLPVEVTCPESPQFSIGRTAASALGVKKFGFGLLGLHRPILTANTLVRLPQYHVAAFLLFPFASASQKQALHL